MPTRLGVGDFLQPGSTYTFIFSISSITATGNKVLQDLQDLSFSDTHFAFFGLLANRFDLVFTWQGNPTTVADVAYDVKNAIESNHYLTTVDLIVAVQAIEPITTVFPAYSPGGGISDSFSNAASNVAKILPSSGSLWAIALIGFLVLFVLVGGVGLTRRVTS